MTPRENLIRTIRRDEPAWIPYRYDGSLTLLRPKLVTRAVDGLDDWGVRWIGTGTAEGSYPEGSPVLAVDEVDRFEPPRTDWPAVAADLREQVENEAGEDTLLIAYDEETLFERAQRLLGVTEFLMAVVQQPERLETLLDEITQYQQSLVRTLMDSGVAGVRFTDDWGTQNGLFISPSHWRELIKPRMASLYQVVKERGGLVFQHSCGHIDPIVRDLIEIGVDVVDPCQPAANNIFSWKRRFGDRLTFMGGLDTQGFLSLGSPEEVETTVVEVVSVMAEGGGYIAAPSHTITLPEANREAMLRALAKINGDRTA